jgi:hypothetical protein
MWSRLRRRTFGPKKEEVTGGRAKLHNAELHIFVSSPDKIRMIKSRRMKRAGLTTCSGGKRNTYNILVKKLEEMRPLRRHRCRLSI